MMIDRKSDLVALSGENYVFDDPETLDNFSKDQSFAPPIKPGFVVRPENVEQVQKIVQWATGAGTPLIPVSSGPPHFHGDTVPGVSGAIVLDLTRMNKIIKIDRRNRLVIIEPGVTYSQLQPELAGAGMRLSTSLLPRANKSVIASLLEREPRLNSRYQWSSLDPLRSLEVVWGDGNRLWTGGAGNDVMDLEKQWSQQKWPLDPTGPGQTDFYRFLSAAQGSMGIATWATLRCEVLPRVHKLFFVPAGRLAELHDFTYTLLRYRYADELCLVNNANLACIIGGGTDRIRKLKEQLPSWTALVGIAGRDELPEERVDFQEKDIADIARSFSLELLPSLPGADGAQVLDLIKNPSREPYWKFDYKGGCQDIFFITTLDRTYQFSDLINREAESSGYPAADIGVYIQPRHQGVNCHCEFNLPYQPDGRQEEARAKDLFLKASKALFDHGAFYSRPYGAWAEYAFARDPRSTGLLKKIKGIFDPQAIMNPGKLCFTQMAKEEE